MHEAADGPLTGPDAGRRRCPRSRRPDPDAAASPAERSSSSTVRWTAASRPWRCSCTTTTPGRAERPAADQARPLRTGPDQLPDRHQQRRGRGLRRPGYRRAGADRVVAGPPGRLPDRRRGAVLHRRTRSSSSPRWPTRCRSTSTPSGSPPISAAGCSPGRPGCSSWPTRCRRCRSRCCAGAAGSAGSTAGWSTAGSSGRAPRSLVADTDAGPTDAAAVRYQVLCRTHHRSGELGPSAMTGTPS